MIFAFKPLHPIQLYPLILLVLLIIKTMFFLFFFFFFQKNTKS